MSRGVGFAVVAQSLLHNAEENEGAASAAAAAAIDEADAPTRSHEVHVPDVADRVLRNLAEDTVRRIDLDENTMPENLPALTAPELKLIGRCVCFGMKQTINGVASVYYYTGLVTAVTAAAVTLMHVNRYTESNFKAYKERERKTSGRHHHSSNAEDDDNAAAANEPLDFPATDCTAGSLVLTGDVPRLTARESVGMTDDVTHFPYSLSDVFSAGGFGAALGQPKDARGSLCPAVKMITGEELENLSVHHHHHHSGDTRGTQVDSNGSVRSTAASATVHAASLRTCRDSLGPLPCATFLRKAIHDVKFGRAPDNTFFKLFNDPSKSLMDMQYLRMFVRRYLVHTAENNNPRRLPLHRYVVKHGACPGVAWAEVEAVAREELLALMKVDRAIAKEKRRMRTRNARREEAIRDYRAPPGLFASTGFLYLTGLPQGSLLAAATLLFFTLAFGFNFVLTVQVFGEGLTQWIFHELSDYVTAALVIWMATSFLTAYHALAMRVPSLANAPVLVLRGMFSVASAVYAIACMAVISQCASNDYLYESMKRSPADALCGFYETHQCSGFYRSCGSASMQDNSICLNCVPMVLSPTPCYTAITEQLQRVVIPLFLFSIVIFLGSVHGLFLLLRLFLVARAASLTSGI